MATDIAELDYREFEEREDGLTDQICRLADELEEAQRDLAEKEVARAASEARVRALAEVRIPEMAERIGRSEFALGRGRYLRVESKIRASISEANAEEAHDWLERNGHGGIIKRQIVVGFAKDQEDRAAKLLEALRMEYESVKQKMDVHSSTLKAWVTRRLKDGELIPPSITVDEGKLATIETK